MVIAMINIEIIGAPKEHVDKSLNMVVDTISKMTEPKTLKKEVFEAKEYNEKLFSAFTEMELEFKDIKRFFEFCLKYNPTSVSIIEPGNFSMNALDLSELTNLILNSNHEFYGELKKFKAQNQILDHNVVNLLKNNIGLSIQNKEKNLADLSKAMGIKEKELKPFVDSLVKENKLILEKGIYKLKK